MKDKLKFFWSLCILRKGPQDIPHQINFFAIVLCLDIVTQSLYLWAMGSAALIFHYIIRLGLVLFFTWLTLLVAKKSERWLQTVTALLAIDVLLNLVGFIAQRLWMFSSIELNSGTLSLIFMLALIGVAIWHWFANANIYRHALNTSFTLGVLVALLIIVLSNTALVMQMMTNVGAA